MIDQRVLLAQELHDGIAQDLIGLGFSIDAIIASAQDPLMRNSLRSVRFSISEIIDKVRLEIHQLRTATDLVDDLTKQDFSYELIRALAEVLRNVAEHSKATKLLIQVSDNGIGGATAKEGSFGLIGVRERIRNLNGDIQIVSDEQGTRITIELPLRM